ncbi:MAG TPA: hypothetical protein VLG17_18765 [Pseudomonas sp.]|uniref:hypothetical protein n=1 Tax=Pseudomonas sp. TaxID=306 RepID=UPI002C8AB535|nr:hypothetical protein [Pseudomonas sp.]HSX90022.1 hypothetical protein [Pseudomonas sp.]
MPSAVERYKQLLSGALARYFPRTTAYLRAEREAAAAQQKPRARQKKSATPARKTKAGGAKKIGETPNATR